MGYEKLNPMFRTLLVTMVMSLSGCLSTTEYNPFVDIDVSRGVVVEDFEGPGKAGYEFAARRRADHRSRLQSSPLGRKSLRYRRKPVLPFYLRAMGRHW